MSNVLQTFIENQGEKRFSVISNYAYTNDRIRPVFDFEYLSALDDNEKKAFSVLETENSNILKREF